jgi:hypothetical protein
MGEALLESDAARLKKLLAEDFIWIHNHASGIDTKSTLLERASNSTEGVLGPVKSRISSNVDVRILGTTGVVTGFTAVDRDTSQQKYNFMRTHVEISGRCILLANHTLEISPENE